METLQRTANRGSISTGYDIDNSYKNENDNGEKMTHTYDSAPTSQQKGTISIWYKRTEISTNIGIFQFGDDASGDYLAVRWGSEANGSLETYRSRIGGTNVNIGDANGAVRDTSAWYHMVIAIDTTQATATNRFRVYRNGEELAFSTDNRSSITQNANMAIGENGKDILIGEGVYKFNGYIAEVNYIDGQQLSSTDFGEYDSDSGIWIPKKYTGTYGNNGFYLDFKNASNLGEDQSGNNHDFTLNNITSADQATDTPTNNGCTLNVLASLEGSNDITEGALVSTGGSGSFNGTYGTIGIDPFNSTVDWYWEIEASSTTNGSSDDIGIGWIKESRITSGSTAFNNVYADGISRYSSQTATAAGDIWGVLLETGATPVFKLYRNDSLIYTATHGSGGVSFDTLMFPYITVKGTGTDARLNFLNPASSFSIASGNTDPNGYGNFEFDTKGGYALCTKNLAEYG